MNPDARLVSDAETLLCPVCYGITAPGPAGPVSGGLLRYSVAPAEARAHIHSGCGAGAPPSGSPASRSRRVHHALPPTAPYCPNNEPLERPQRLPLGLTLCHPAR